jgi:hypothetical protein
MNSLGLLPTILGMGAICVAAPLVVCFHPALRQMIKV